jgi:signal peptidase I
VVADRSMAPRLLPGDRLWVDRGAYRDSPPRPGDVVVLVDPVDRGRWLVKRVAAVDVASRTVAVRGDASDVARDSRHFGPVGFDAVRGRAYWLYHPADRAGPI